MEEIELQEKEMKVKGKEEDRKRRQKGCFYCKRGSGKFRGSTSPDILESAHVNPVSRIPFLYARYGLPPELCSRRPLLLLSGIEYTAVFGCYTQCFLQQYIGLSRFFTGFFVLPGNKNLLFSIASTLSAAAFSS